MEKGVIVKGAKVFNFAKFDKIECVFNSGVTYLCGKNGAGKSSLMNTLEACIKGVGEQAGKFFANRFTSIGPNKVSADIEWEFFDKKLNGNFFIKNHITKQGSSITFRKGDNSPIPDDYPLDFFQWSLMSASKFCALTGPQQAIELGIDTSSFDENIKKYKEEITYINREIKQMGVIDEVEKVEPVDINSLKAKKEEIRSELNTIYNENRAKNKVLKDGFDEKVKKRNDKESNQLNENTDMRVKFNRATDALSVLINLGYGGNEARKWINTTLTPPELEILPEIPTPEYIDEMPSDEKLIAVDEKITAAYETNAKADKYSEYLKAVGNKKQKETNLESWQVKVDGEAKERLNYINLKDFGFKDLCTDETGCLTFKGRKLREPEFSKGELEMIVAKLAVKMNPLFVTRFIDEFGILDPDNQKKLVDDLIEAGFQVIVAVPGEEVKHDNSIVLRECKIVDGENDEREDLI